jgi:hypothetical protein
MRWLVERKFALDRYKRPITPESVRTALAA